MRLESIIKQRALEAGFDLAGIAPDSALKDLKFLAQWVKKGHGGEMRYLADPKREAPHKVLPSVKSIICVGLIYNTPFPYSIDIPDLPDGEEGSNSLDAPMHEEHPQGRKTPHPAAHGRHPLPSERENHSPLGSIVELSRAKGPKGHAWISRYAWGNDYHHVMRSKLEQLRRAIEGMAPDVETRVYVDTGPIVERAFARISGIGWMGKNTCLINEQKGSWFFLGVILTNLELELDSPAPDRCGSCTRCLDACPTGALVEPYVMDASRCISYFNIELRGAIPEEYRAAIGRNVFGCDICQDVCPWNHPPLSVANGAVHDGAAHDEKIGSESPRRGSATTNLPEFQPMQVEVKSCQPFAEVPADDEPVAEGATTEPFSLFNPDIGALAGISEEDFQRVFARSPIKRAKYRGWMRNLCVVMGNSGNPRFIAPLEAAAEDSDPLVREHAAWALQRLRSKE